MVRAARERGFAVIGELELGWRLLPNEVIAITGSNGKTTTTELVGQIHREAGLPVAVAGNVGTALQLAGGHARPGGRGGLRGVVVPARGHATRSRPRPRCCSTSRPTTSTVTARSPPTATAKLRIFARQDAEAIAVVPAGLERRGARAAASCSLADRRRPRGRGRARASRAGSCAGAASR